MNQPSARPEPGRSPFNLDNDPLYQQWRDRKLDGYPSRLEDLVVAIGDARQLTRVEHRELLARCRKANMVIYAGPDLGEERLAPVLLARQLGIDGLDQNWLADGDGLTSLTVVERGTRQLYIPYTDKPINWHTDGYYNPDEGQIESLMLHCVCPAAEGGENALLDHEVAYIQLRDQDPAHIEALMRPDAMTIPARIEGGHTARPEQPGPVFSIDPLSGNLHMRYTARKRNVIWSEDPAVQAAKAALEALLEGPNPYIFRGRLEAGMGLVSNNILHDRSGFRDDAGHKRLLYRARFYRRIPGTGWAL